ncbi:MAG: sugar ABC transporter ATP-binding protein [Actinomycetota bacterium]
MLATTPRSDAPDGQAPPTAVLRGLTKSYGGVVVLDHVDLDLYPGTVHALLGENGAGKSTLIKVLSGVVRPDDGEIEIEGRRADIHSPHDATEAGIATLHQELSMVPGLSVAENVFLGRRPPSTFGVVRWRDLNREAASILDELGQRIDPRRDAARLSPVEQTMTAIARAVSLDAKVLVLDEPTAALTDQETEQLFATIRRLTARGVAVLYVSHRLDEVMDICDSFTVLRNGVEVDRGMIDDATIDRIIAAMVGRSIDAVFPPRPEPIEQRTVVLATRGLSGRRAHDVSIEVHEGEVFGIAGLAGSGRSEIVRLLAGAQKVRDGEIELDGKSVVHRSVRHGQRNGVALLPQERRGEGVIPDSVERNANVTTLDHHTRARVVMYPPAANAHAQGLTELLSVRHHSLSQPILTLSGGNQQKVVLAKFLALSPRVLLLDEPTRGVDVGTRSEIYHLVRDQAQLGTAVIVVSSELPELLGWCDRITVMHEGNQIATFDAASTDEHELLEACYGRTR